jgi:hypothetical protein
VIKPFTDLKIGDTVWYHHSEISSPGAVTKKLPSVYSTTVSSKRAGFFKLKNGYKVSVTECGFHDNLYTRFVYGDYGTSTYMYSCEEKAKLGLWAMSNRHHIITLVSKSTQSTPEKLMAIAAILGVDVDLD